MANFKFMFLVNDRLGWREEQFHEPWNFGARYTRAFYVFHIFENLKSSFSEENMPVHTLDVFIENATKIV